LHSSISVRNFINCFKTCGKQNFKRLGTKLFEINDVSVCTVNGIIDFNYINYLRICLLPHAGGRSNYFVVGLTNVSPWVKRPKLWQYTLCGQYPGKVHSRRPNTHVSLYCRENLPPFRYVVVQIPMRNTMNVCEIEVHVRGVPCILLCCTV